MRKTIILLFGFILCGCAPSSFNNELVETVSSPNKSSKAIVFERNGGATTGFNRQIVILESGKPFPKNDKLESFFCISGDSKVEVFWQSETSILVRYPLWHQIIRTNSQVGNIKIIYEGR